MKRALLIAIFLSAPSMAQAWPSPPPTPTPTPCPTPSPSPYATCDPADEWCVCDDTVAHWRMDEAWAGTWVLDYAGGGYHGSLQGGDNTIDITVAGKAGTGAFDLDGAADYITGAHVPFLAGDFSVCAWITNDAVVTAAILFSQRDHADDARGFQLFLASGGTCVGLLDLGASSVSVGGGADLRGGDWHFVVARRAGTVLSLWVDGEQIDEDDSAGNDADLSHAYDWQIGRNALYADYFWNGKVDDMRVFDRALTAQEIRYLYAQGAGTAECRAEQVYPVGLSVDPVGSY